MSLLSTPPPGCSTPPCLRHRARWKKARHGRPQISGWRSRPASLQHRLHVVREVRIAPRDRDRIFLQVGLIALAGGGGHRGIVRDDSPEQTKLGVLPLGILAEKIAIGVLFLHRPLPA